MPKFGLSRYLYPAYPYPYPDQTIPTYPAYYPAIGVLPMVTYLLETPDKITRKVVRKNVFYLCEFSLPDSVKDTLTATETATLNTVALCGFYADPSVGNEVVFKDHLWVIQNIRFTVERYNSKAPRQVAKLIMQYVGAI